MMRVSLCLCGLCGALALFGVSACGGGERQVTGPDEGGGTSVARLVIHVGVEAEAADLASALGWEGGIPGAELHLLRNGTKTWKTTTTDESGDAEFPNLLRGLYRIYAGRVLSEEEASGAGQVVRAFGDGVTLDVRSVGDIPLELTLVPDQTKGLVISEVSNFSPPVTETGGSSYNEAVYFEVYNNSPQTLFLDGTIVGVTFFAGETVPTSCATNQFQRDDPAGVYGRRMLAFPGAGAEFPILPGEVKVVPVAAIDHTQVSPLLFDLSGADFEMRSGASADNPSVPNMLDVGLEPFVQSLGGASLLPVAGREAWFLAEPLDPQSLPILYRDGNGSGWVRIPTESLIDVTGFTKIVPDLDRDFPPCIPMVNKRFDRYEGGFDVLELGVENTRVSTQRKILRFESGHAILQDANTSAVDFMLADPTPGTLPPPD